MRRNHRSIKTIALTFTIFMTSFCYAQIGNLDPTFSDSGRVVTDFSGDYDWPYGVAIQNDNKILVSGQTRYLSSTKDVYFSVARYNSDGSLDQSFGTGGLVMNRFDTTDSYGTKLAVQDDGKFVIVGFVRTSSGNDMAVARFNFDGSLDTTFGTAGLVTIHTTDYSSLGDVVIQTDGKILATGGDDNNDFLVIRLNPDGSLDTGFGNNGIVLTDYANRENTSAVITLQPDGKIIVAGTDWLPSTFEIMIVRYNSNGSLDTGFGSNGIVIYGLSGNLEGADAVLLQSDGKIVVGGFTRVGSNPNKLLLLRYNEDGTLDMNFGNNGVVIEDSPTANNPIINAIILQPDNKIIAAGTLSKASWGGEDHLLARFNSNGSVDNGFGTNGYLVTPNAGSISDAALQNDGKLVVAGYFMQTPNYFSSLDFSVARYNLGDIGTSVQADENGFPTNFTLKQNYPNPFNPSTTIEFSIPKESFVTLKVYDLLGREVASLVNKELQAGSYKTQFNASNLASGVYLYRLNANGFVQTKKLMLMK